MLFRSHVGGQIHLSVAAPDKLEVEGAWLYPWTEVQQMGVAVRTGVDATAQQVREFNADLVIMATGALPKAAPIDLSGVDKAVAISQAWDVLANPQGIPGGARVTVLGGGTVGLETADLLVKTRACSVTLIEPRAVLAEGISKSNRNEVIDRLREAGVAMMLKTIVISASGKTLQLKCAEGNTKPHDIGNCLIIAVGAQPNTSATAMLEDARVPFVAVGDCSQVGDFMTCLRDAWMVGSAIDLYMARAVLAHAKTGVNDLTQNIQ